jgi:hypothetical protein
MTSWLVSIFSERGKGSFGRVFGAIVIGFTLWTVARGQTIPPILDEMFFTLVGYNLISKSRMVHAAAKSETKTL